MNAAKLDKSGRLRRTLSILNDGRWHSTRYLVQMANVCAVNSIISELRDNGKKIICRRDGGVWYYRLEVTK